MAPFSILAGAFQKFYLIGNDFRHVPLCAVLSLIATVLNGTVYAHFASLVQIFAAIICQTAPADNVEKIGRAFALLVGKAALNRNGKCANGYTAVCHTQIRVTGKVSDLSSSIRGSGSRACVPLFYG